MSYARIPELLMPEPLPGFREAANCNYVPSSRFAKMAFSWDLTPVLPEGS